MERPNCLDCLCMYGNISQSEAIPTVRRNKYIGIGGEKEKRNSLEDHIFVFFFFC